MDKSYISLPFFAEVYQEEMAHLEVEGVTWPHMPEKKSSGFTWPLLVCLCLQWAILIPHIVLTMSKQPKNWWLDSDVLNQYIVYWSIHRDITIWIPSGTLHIHLDGDDWNNPYLWIIIVTWMWNGHHWTSLSALKGSWHSLFFLEENFPAGAAQWCRG